MPEDIRTIYGDGRLLVTVDEELVVIHHGEDAIDMSRDAFREIVLGWERLHEQEDEAK